MTNPASILAAYADAAHDAPPQVTNGGPEPVDMAVDGAKFILDPPPGLRP
ncbi:hypothetical protein [Mycobacterium avium]|nr:hypothetical protein [Mycobacterium avium]ETB43931.1 hypothetical protein O974_17390 [Mycobacterium avium 11-0986]